MMRDGMSFTESTVKEAVSKIYFAELLAMKEQLEQEVGEPLTWYNPENRRVCRIFLKLPADLNDRSKWPTYFLWLKNKLEILQKVFWPGLKVMDAEVIQQAEEIL